MSFADDIANGEICANCLLPFEDEYEHGYPVLCSSCYDDEDNPVYQKALVPAIGE